MEYLNVDQVLSVIVDANTPTYNQSVSGYGPKIPTRYRLKLKNDPRIRRVYAAVYGNSGSTYVVIGGEDVYLSPDVEYMMEAAN